jgi:hypothetical protein
LDETKTNGKAMASFLTGVLSMITPYIGLILGVVGIAGAFLALMEIKKSRITDGVYQKGESLAVAGIVFSIIGIL